MQFKFASLLLLAAAAMPVYSAPAASADVAKINNPRDPGLLDALLGGASASSTTAAKPVGASLGGTVTDVVQAIKDLVANLRDTVGLRDPFAPKSS